MSKMLSRSILGSGKGKAEFMGRIKPEVIVKEGETVCVSWYLGAGGHTNKVYARKINGEMVVIKEWSE